MCTVITHRQLGHPRTAKKDILVFKLMRSVYCDKSTSSYRRFQYIINQLNTTEFTYDVEHCVNDLHEYQYRETLSNPHYVSGGFHSYASIKRMKKSGMINFLCAAEFIIPKEAKYYINGADNIVSNQIIFKGYLK